MVGMDYSKQLSDNNVAKSFTIKPRNIFHCNSLEYLSYNGDLFLFSMAKRVIGHTHEANEP